MAIAPDTQFRSRFQERLLGAVTVLEGKARVFADGNWDNTLYRPLSAQESKTIDIRLIPYYAWSNRGPSEMRVWLPLR